MSETWEEMSNRLLRQARAQDEATRYLSPLFAQSLDGQSAQPTLVDTPTVKVDNVRKSVLPDGTDGCITAQSMDSGAMVMAHWPSWARMAVVGEQLGTQRTVPHAPRATDGDLRAAQCAVADLSRALDAERAEIAQLRRYNEDLVQMCIARVGERDAALAELTTLRADWQKLMATAATTPQTPPAPTPRDPWANALRRQHQVVGLLTEKPQ